MYIFDWIKEKPRLKTKTTNEKKATGRCREKKKNQQSIIMLQNQKDLKVNICSNGKQQRQTVTETKKNNYNV